MRLPSLRDLISLRSDPDGVKQRSSEAGVRNSGHVAESEHILAVLADETVPAETLRSRLEGVDGRKYVLAPDTGPDWALTSLGAQHRVARTLPGVVSELILIGPIDDIVDLRDVEEDERVDTFQHLIWHVRRGGTLTVQRQRRQTASGLVLLLGRLLARDDTTDRQLMRAVQSYSVSRDEIIVRKGNSHLLKLREADASRVLQSRLSKTSVRDLAVLKGGRYHSRSKLSSHGSSVELRGFPTAFDYPSVTLRHYTGPIHVMGNALVHTEAEVLPESFPHSFGNNPQGNRMRRTSYYFAEPFDGKMPTRHLDGIYYHVDSVNPGHFGHLMTDVVGRLWGWPFAKERFPELKAIFRLRYPNERDPELEKLVFTAAGIPLEDIVWVDEPVTVDSLIGASPMFHNHRPYFVHPAISDVWDTIKQGLVQPDVIESPERIFVSRRAGRKNRDCRNSVEVEQLFREHDWDVFFPEDHPLRYQATLFSRARQIAGFGGSGLFNLMHADGLERLIVLNHEAYTARNEHLFATIKGGEEHFFWSRPDISHPEGRWSEEAYYSPWSFDFDRNLPDLKPLIA